MYSHRRTSHTNKNVFDLLQTNEHLIFLKNQEGHRERLSSRSYDFINVNEKNMPRYISDDAAFVSISVEEFVGTSTVCPKG